MISYIKGIVSEVGDGYVVIENNGIGYIANVADASAWSGISGKAEETIVFTQMIVREDDISLCGFKTRQDLQMFNKLLTVNGVGTKAALALLGTLSTESLSKAIVFEDVDSIVRAPGVGKKSAQRIVLELKDKLGDISGFTPEEASFADESVSENIDGSNAKAEALQALVALGYSKAEAAGALGKIKEEYDNSQEYIRKALSKLA